MYWPHYCAASELEARMGKPATHCWHEMGACLLMCLFPHKQTLKSSVTGKSTELPAASIESALSRLSRSLGTSRVRLDAHLLRHHQLHAPSPARI